nr:MAG TPA: hypothetical protein [Caudoviricetes sp.]
MNDFVKRLRRERDAAMGVAERCTRQYELDCWQIALARYDKLKLGYQRIMEITALADQVREEYSGAVLAGPEQDVHRAHMDAELAQIMRDQADRLIPFERRYQELGSDTYRGRKHGV